MATTKEMKKPPIIDHQLGGDLVIEEGSVLEAGFSDEPGIVDDTTERDRAVV